MWRRYQHGEGIQISALHPETHLCGNEWPYIQSGMTWHVEGTSGCGHSLDCEARGPGAPVLFLGAIAESAKCLFFLPLVVMRPGMCVCQARLNVAPSASGYGQKQVWRIFSEFFCLFAPPTPRLGCRRKKKSRTGDDWAPNVPSSSCSTEWVDIDIANGSP